MKLKDGRNQSHDSPHATSAQNPWTRQKNRWLFQDDGSYIHIDCIGSQLLLEYKAFLEKKIAEHDFKLLSKFDPREPFIENSVWHKTMSESQKHEDI